MPTRSWHVCIAPVGTGLVTFTPVLPGGVSSGGVVGLMQYAALPIVIMVQTLFLFRGVFSTDYTGNQVFGWNE